MEEEREKDLKRIQTIVGEITTEEMKNLECFISDNMGIFIPATGPCYYSTTEDHQHPGYSFIIPHDDNCKVVINHQQIETEHGRMYGFSPDVVHHEIVEDQFSRYVAIFIDSDFFNKEYGRYKEIDDLQLVCTEFNPPEGLTVYLKDFMFEFENKNPGYELLLEALSLKITHLIIREMLNYNIFEEKISYRFDIDRVIEYIYDNYGEDLSVEKLAGVIALSPSHFSRIFKSETGSSPMEFLIRVRLNIAKKYLIKGEISITEIALKCGFNSSSHFSSSFMKYFQITPSQYKEITLK